MPHSDKNLLEFITRLTYNIDGLSGELKLYFSQYLTFHFSKTLSSDQILDIENKKASSVFGSKEEMLEATTTFSNEDRIWCIASIQRLQAQAEKIDDRIVSRRIGQLLRDLISMFGLENDVNKIAEEKRRIEAEIFQFLNRTVIRIPARIWPLTLDYVIRWVLLLSFSYLGLNKNLLTAVNTFLVPIFVLILVLVVGRRHMKANKQLLNSYGEQQEFKIVYYFSTSQYTWLAVFLGTSVFISYLLPDQLHVLAFFGLTLYYSIYLRLFRLGRIEENDLIKQLEIKKINTASLNVDENDEYIVALETKLNSSTSRLEAYILESALFGALAFSGFLQIMATDLVSFQDLENFASYIFTTAQAFIHFDWVQLKAGAAGLSNKVSLFCLVSVESLICSIFFLAVIASRLRFSDIADKVRTSINLAKAYNAKEEAFLEEKLNEGKKTERLDVLTSKVNEQLHEATLILQEITPVMAYMEYFRNAGIIVFLVILISSSLFITGVLGWTFLVLVLATYFYFNRSIINHKFKALFLTFRIQFIKKGYWLIGFALFPQVLAYTLRIAFHLRETDPLIALSYVLIGLYVFAWLLLAAHVDEQFGEIESAQNQLRQSRWKFIKNTMAVLILLFSIAMAFKSLHLTGANEMLIISLTAMSLLMYFVGYYLTKVRWLGIICGWIMAVAGIGILFRVQHWAGGNEMVLVALCAFPILIPIVLWKRKLFHMLLIRFCLAGILFSVWYSNFNWSAPTRLQLAYEHETMNVGRLFQLCDVNLPELILKKKDDGLAEKIKETDKYIQQYGTRFGFTLVYRALVINYQDFGLDVLGTNKPTPRIDSVLLPLALRSAREEYKILSLFNYNAPPFVDLEMEANILLAMGKREEAIRSLENILLGEPLDDRREIIKARVVLMKSQSHEHDVNKPTND